MTGPDVFVISVTASCDGLAHLADDTALGHSVDGRLRAHCGTVITPAPMAAPSGPSCPLCAGPAAAPWSGRARSA